MSVRAAVVASAAGIAAAVLLWPTDNCVSTLIGAPAGAPDPNTRTCTSLLGLPSNTAVAVLVSLLLAAAVYAVARRRSQ